MQETVLVQIPGQPWWKRWWGILIILILGTGTIFTLWFGALVYSNVKMIRSGALKPLSSYNSDFTGSGAAAGTASKGAQLIRPENATMGKGDHTIVEFGDFECPFTAKEFPVIRPLMEKVLGVKFVFRNFPLTTIHTHAYNVALAGTCAKAQGKFWEYHDQVFLNQTDLTDTALAHYAQTAGLDTDKFATCFSDKTYKDEVARDAQDGYALGVRGTPTFFIDGFKVEGAIPTDAWTVILGKLGISVN